MTMTAAAMNDIGVDRTYPSRAAVISWIFFSWATQPYFTLITTFVFAPYFATHVAPVTRKKISAGNAARR